MTQRNFEDITVSGYAAANGKGMRFEADVQIELTKPGQEIQFRGKRGDMRTVVIDREWNVRLDGESIGKIQYVMATRETGSSRRTYVSSRWQSPAWTYHRKGMGARGMEVTSRRQGIERLVQRYVEDTMRAERA